MPPKKSSKATSLSYSAAGVNIDVADKAKKQMAETLKTKDARVLNSVGAFASLYDASFPEYDHPVLVLKTEEPGSKQLLAFQYDRVESICQDMINHLINDIAVMGATPLAVQDLVVCGKLQNEIVQRIVKGIADACRAHGCTLTGGETSEQPGMLEAGRYVLGSSIVGVVEKTKIIDGSAIREGDAVIAVASNGLHTNGYSLVRKLMKEKPEILNETVGGQSFIDAILTPHLCYYPVLKELFAWPELHGLAHITGGGIQGNLNRVLPGDLDAAVDLSTIKVLPIFSLIQTMGNVPEADMLRTYNMGVGLTIVASADAAEKMCESIKKKDHDAYVIGEITKGKKEVAYSGKVRW